MWKRWLTASTTCAAALATAQMLSPNQNWDPPAITVHPSHQNASNNPQLVSKLIQDGQVLFSTKFNVADGAGRPAATGDSKPTIRASENDHSFTRLSGPDANSCAGCHNEPAVGGSGEFAANVFVGAQFADPPILATSTDQTSERNTPSLFGTGVIEMLAREMTRDLLAARDKAVSEARRNQVNVVALLRSKGVDFGSLTARPDGTVDAAHIEGVDSDLVIKPFGWKGVVISLREFSVNALNQHHGMEAVERFGWERTGRRDFDEDGVEIEFTVGQTTALTLFQASLPVPGRNLQKSSGMQSTVSKGESIFAAIGCSRCHIASLRLEARGFSEPNPYNRPGNLLPQDGLGEIRYPFRALASGGLTPDRTGHLFVHAYTDLKRHRICDDSDAFLCNERLRQDNVPTDQFLTPRLWDLSTSAPYGHRGDCTTLSEIIEHHAGEAKPERRSFDNLDDESKRSLILFLRSLGSPPGVTPMYVAESTPTSKGRRHAKTQ